MHSTIVIYYRQYVKSYVFEHLDTIAVVKKQFMFLLDFNT